MGIQRKCCHICSKILEQEIEYKPNEELKFCDESVRLEILNGKRKCQKCSFDYDFITKLKTFKRQCDGCNKTKYLLDNCVIKICDNHSHCDACLFQVLKSPKCQKCNRIVSENDFKRVEDILVSKCSVCENKIEKKYFIPKDCCDVPICVVCQLKYTKKDCQNCSCPLSDESIGIVNSVKKLIL